MDKIFIPNQTIAPISCIEFRKYFQITSNKNQANILLCRFNSKLTPPYLEKFTSLQVIVTLTTGTDHIDSQYCQENNIVILSLKNNFEELQNIKSSAEHALLLSIFAARGSLPIFQESLFDLSNNFYPDLFPNEISMQTFGIIGYGRIGKYLASILSLISKKIMIYDPHSVDSLMNNNVTAVDSIEALIDVDNLIVSCTYNTETIGLIDRDFFDLLSSDKLLNIINIARGPIVNAKDFCYTASSNSKLRYFLDVGDSYSIEDQKCLEVFQQESRQILCTPHIAGQAASAIYKADMIGLTVLLDWLNGEDNS